MPFLGLASYYHCFIPNFATCVAPLPDLLHKGQPRLLQWTAEALHAALYNKPIFQIPQRRCPFLLFTDALGVGLGTVLSQQTPEDERPIQYISGKLSGVEQQYAAIKKETSAIKWAVETLCSYL